MTEHQVEISCREDKALRWLPWVFTHGIVLSIAFSILLSSCFDESFESDVQVELVTSVDTLRFDTVFTTIGSITRQIIVSNPTNTNINITSISLDRGDQSMFRLNVDGIPGSRATEVPVLANDSVHLFVEVTVDPDQPLSISPFIIEEFLTINSGGSEKKVQLEAWGQNANYFPSRNTQGQIVGLGCRGGQITWDDPRPYVINGLLFIDSCEIVVPPGTQIFVHGGIARQDDIIFGDGGLFFLPDGRLTISGTVDNPVIIQGDRLEPAFADVPGQWAGIRFLAGSTGHSIRHAEIRNSTVGIRADSASNVDISNVIIANTSNIGLLAIHAELQADNLLIHSNGPQSIAMTFGGSYNFRHCTIANFQNQSAGVFMDNFTCRNEECSVIETNPLEVNFTNSIIMGSNDNEIDIVDIAEGMDPALFSLVLDHTLVKVLDENENYPPSSCISCIEQIDQPVFLDELNDDYTLDTMSVARGAGIFLSDLPTDIEGFPRDQSSPDIGCFEFQ